MKFGYIGLVVNEYTGLVFDCGTSGAKPNVIIPAATCTPNGEMIMSKNGYDRYTVGYCAGCMIVYIAVCRLTSYLALRFIKM